MPSRLSLLLATIAMAGCELFVTQGLPDGSQSASDSGVLPDASLGADAGDGGAPACSGAVTGTWTLAVPGSSGGLLAVAGTGPDNVWAVGGGRALHHDGTGGPSNWVSTSVPTGVLDLTDVAVVSKDEAFAATNGSGALRWTSAAGWTVLPSSPTTHYAVWAVGPGDAWFLSFNGVARHWTEASGWSAAVATGTSSSFKRVWGTGDQAWATTLAGEVVRYNGSAWSVDSQSGNGANDLHGIHGVSGADIWAVGGGSSEGVAMHRQALGWARGAAVADLGTSAWWLRGVWGSCADDFWAVGSGGLVFHWDGANWTRVTPFPSTQNLNDLWGSGPNDIWAVSAAGELIHYQ